MGETNYYSNTGTFISRAKVTSGTNWSMATVVLDHHNAILLRGYTWQKRYHLVGHEFGHALGLNHFFDSAFLQPAHSGDHWMSEVTGLTAPSSEDQDHLAHKY